MFPVSLDALDKFDLGKVQVQMIAGYRMYTSISLRQPALIAVLNQTLLQLSESDVEQTSSPRAVAAATDCQHCSQFFRR